MSDFSNFSVFRNWKSSWFELKVEERARKHYTACCSHMSAWCTLVFVVNLFNSLSRFYFLEPGYTLTIGRRTTSSRGCLPPHIFFRRWTYIIPRKVSCLPQVISRQEFERRVAVFSTAAMTDRATHPKAITLCKPASSLPFLQSTKKPKGETSVSRYEKMLGVLEVVKPAGSKIRRSHHRPCIYCACRDAQRGKGEAVTGVRESGTQVVRHRMEWKQQLTFQIPKDCRLFLSSRCRKLALGEESSRSWVNGFNVMDAEESELTQMANISCISSDCETRIVVPLVFRRLSSCEMFLVFLSQSIICVALPLYLSLFFVAWMDDLRNARPGFFICVFRRRKVRLCTLSEGKPLFFVQ